MANLSVVQPEMKTSALLQVAGFLARPQRFVAVAEARAGLRETLEQAQAGSIVLTNNGAPAAAIIPFDTLEEMRQTVMGLLVGEMEASLQRTQVKVQAMTPDEPTSEEELETMARAAVRRARRPTKQLAKRRSAR